MEIICNLYKPDTGKWYGEHTFIVEYSDFIRPTNEEIWKSCETSYTNPRDFIIHVSYRNMSKIILPQFK